MGQGRAQSRPVIFQPITSAPTRVAALLSGEVDVIDPVPLQDVARINQSANARVLEGPEVRTIYLSFDRCVTNSPPRR